MVLLYINRRSDGTGNEKWDSSYNNRLMIELTELSQRRVEWHIHRTSYIDDTNAWNRASQLYLLSTYQNLRQQGYVTAIVSQPSPTDSTGRAFTNLNYSPYFVFASRRNDGSDADVNWAARVFLHELGHNMGMRHPNYSNPPPIHIDNYYRTDTQRLVDYIWRVIA